jgi:hypothetical protein
LEREITRVASGEKFKQKFNREEIMFKGTTIRENVQSRGTEIKTFHAPLQLITGSFD